MKVLFTSLLIVTLSVFLTASVNAAPVACLGTSVNGDTGTMAELASNMNSVDGCFVADKIFTGFSSSGFGDLSILETEINSLQNPPNPDFHGFTFLSAPGDAIASGVYEIMYTVSVDPAFPLQFINSHSAGLNENAGADNLTYAVTGVGAASVAPLDVTAGTATGGIAPLTQGPLTFTLALDVGDDRLVTEFNHQVFQTTVPVPSAYLLMGTGLVGLVGWRWWSTKTT